MWDNAVLLRNIANALLLFSAGLVLYGVAYYVTHLPGLFPLHSVRLSNAPQRVEAVKVLQVARSEVQGNFFTVDIERLKNAFEKLPWVRSVNIRREFPDSLVVSLEEHQALARWNRSAQGNHSELVNRQGEVFAAASNQQLPEFSGPDGSADEVARNYALFNRQLAMLGLQAEQVTLSPRHAWELCLSNGIVLELGRDEMQQRLARFVEVYPYALADRPGEGKKRNAGAIAYVDLRYRNGFAVRRSANERG